MNSNNSNIYFVNGLSIKPHCAVGFSFALNQSKRSLLPKINKSIGKLSIKAKARMNNAINWMIYLSQGKKYYSKKTKQQHKLQINFITLTLCSKQFHDDKYIVEKMLKPFLKWMKRQGNTLYVWRAETQSNGNLHFHITSNKYLHWESIRNKWNDIQRKNLYIKHYIESGGDENPNSTDVSGVKDTKFLTSYMVKYMGKSAEDNYCTRYLSIDDKPKIPDIIADDNTRIRIVIADYTTKKDKSIVTIRRDVTCKVWNCSTELMNKRITITEMDNGFETIATEIEDRCTAKQFDGMKLYYYPSDKFRNGLIDYTCEQIAINDMHNNKK